MQYRDAWQFLHIKILTVYGIKFDTSKCQLFGSEFGSVLEQISF